MKILNLYACLGGNRYKWNEVKEDIQVTAIELDTELARLYKERFPNDTVIVTDAHQYLLEHYKEYDFIWSSPPANGKNPIFPDMKLYEEIIFLEHHFKGKYVVENVIPYYEPMLNPFKRNRHLYWTNFKLPNKLSNRTNSGKLNQKSVMQDLCNFHNYNFKKYKGSQRMLKIARNLVDYEAGKTIFETVLGIVNDNNKKQTKLF